MLCLDLPHLEVKFKIVKEFTFPSQKKDAGGQRVRARENRGPEGYRGWELPMATGLKITGGQRTMSGLIVGLTGQTLVWPVIFACLSLNAFCSITL